MRRSVGPRLFTLADEQGRGRCVMIGHEILCSIISWLTGSVFYTSFLMIYGIDLVNIGIITFIPIIAGCFCVFSPSLLERFPKRRWLLVGGRLLYFVLNILGITLTPVLVQDPGGRIVCFAVILFLSNLINALVGSGVTIWHLNFIPDNVRADYFMKSTFISSTIGIGVSLLSAVVADALAASPYGDTIIIVFRYVAFFLALADVALLALPKEYPYPRTASRPRLRDIITMPLSSKPFMLTMLVMFAHTFFTNIPVSFENYYLLNNVGIQYTFIYAINALYPVTLLLFRPIVGRLIPRYGWLKVVGVSMLVHAPSWMAYACVTSGNYAWLYPTVRIYQHIVGVALNITYANVIYINLPESDQTNYLSFHQLGSSVFSFLGMMVGTGLVALIGEHAWTLLGMTFTSVQSLLLLQALGNIVVPLIIFKAFRILDPDTREKLAS